MEDLHNAKYALFKQFCFQRDCFIQMQYISLYIALTFSEVEFDSHMLSFVYYYLYMLYDYEHWLVYAYQYSIQPQTSSSLWFKTKFPRTCITYGSCRYYTNASNSILDVVSNVMSRYSFLVESLVYDVFHDPSLYKIKKKQIYENIDQELCKKMYHKLENMQYTTRAFSWAATKHFCSHCSECNCEHTIRDVYCSTHSELMACVWLLSQLDSDENTIRKIFESQVVFHVFLSTDRTQPCARPCVLCSHLIKVVNTFLKSYLLDNYNILFPGITVYYTGWFNETDQLLGWYQDIHR